MRPSQRATDANASVRRRSRLRAGFTLVEVLAAVTFMAVVIPVAVEGLRIANRVGQSGQRKVLAARVAERILSEYLITRQIVGTTQSGSVQEGPQTYRWTLKIEPWTQNRMQNTMRLVTVSVVYPVQSQEYDVSLSTLVDAAITSP